MNLDELLSQPLPEIPDARFSARVMAEMARQEIRRARIEAAVWMALAAAATLILALTPPGRELAAAALSLGFVAQLCVGLAVLLFLFPPKVLSEQSL